MAINTQNGNTLLESGMFPPCRAATTGTNIALSGLQTIDGVALAAGDRVLVKDQTDPTTNGLYAASTGSWLRTTDAEGNSQFFDGMAVNVAQGLVNAGQAFLCTCTDDPVVVGSSLLTFAWQSSVAQAMQQATSTSSLALTTGAKTLAIQAGKNFSPKQWVHIFETSNPDNNLLAEITSYGGTSLGVSVAAVGGTGGPYTDWTVVLTNTPAAAGRQAPIGIGNVTGPGSSTDSHLAIYDGPSGKLLKDSGIIVGTLAGRNALQFADAATASIRASDLAADVGAVPFAASQPNDNLVLSNDATNPTTDMAISPGWAPDDTGVARLRLAGAMLKRLDAVWAPGGMAGVRAGGLDTDIALQAGKTYHGYLIGKLAQSVTQYSRTSNVATLSIAGHGLGVGSTLRASGIGAGFDGSVQLSAVTTNTVSYPNTGADVAATATAAGLADGIDLIFSRQDLHSYPSPTLPSGWTLKQCVGSVLTDGSGNIRAMTQYGDLFMLGTPLLEVNAVGIASGVGTLSVLGVPLGVRVQAIINARTLDGGNTNFGVYVSAPAAADIAPATGAAPLANIGILTGASGSTFGQITCHTNTAAQVRARGTSNGGSWSASTLGWRDPRRRLF